MQLSGFSYESNLSGCINLALTVSTSIFLLGVGSVPVKVVLLIK